MECKDLVSIIVPVYNSENYLNECVDSLLNQTYSNLEIILVDDGSTDGSINICDQYGKLINVKVIHQCNQGVSAARKSGVNLSIGDYIMFVDSDDWIDKNCIEYMIEKMKIEQADMVSCGYVREYEKSSFETQIFDGEKVFKGKEFIDKYYRRLFGLIENELEHPEKLDCLSSPAMKMYPKKALASADYIDTKVVGSGEDLLMNISAMSNINSIVYVDKCFYHYRKNNNSSITHTYRPNLIEQWDVLYNYIENYIEKYKLNESFRMALNNRIAIGMIGYGLAEIDAPKTFIEKVKQFKSVLNRPRYKETFANLDLSYLHGKWKIFFFVCKNKLCWILVTMLYAMKILKKYKSF